MVNDSRVVMAGFGQNHPTWQHDALPLVTLWPPRIGC